MIEAENVYGQIARRSRVIQLHTDRASFSGIASSVISDRLTSRVSIGSNGLTGKFTVRVSSPSDVKLACNCGAITLPVLFSMSAKGFSLIPGLNPRLGSALPARTAGKCQVELRL